MVIFYKFTLKQVLFPRSPGIQADCAAPLSMIMWKGSANRFPFHLDDLGSANGYPQMAISGSANRFPGIIAPLVERDGTNTGRTRTEMRDPAFHGRRVCG